VQSTGLGRQQYKSSDGQVRRVEPRHNASVGVLLGLASIGALFLPLASVSGPWRRRSSLQPL